MRLWTAEDGLSTRASVAGRTTAPTLAGIAIITGTLLGYSQFLGTGFGATDSLSLIETSRLNGLVAVFAQFSQPVMAGTRFELGEVVYRPFVSTTFGLDYALWGMNAFGYHLTNLVLHVGAVLGVWLLLTALGLRWWTALLGAAAFDVHPLVVASVPVIARRDSIVPVMAFTLGTGLLLLAVRRRGWRRYVMLIAAFALVAIALLSKESSFAALALMPVLLYSAFVGVTDNFRLAARKTLVVFLPFVALAIIVFAIRWNVLHGLGGKTDSPSLLAVDVDRYSHTLGAFTRNLLWAFAGLGSSTREIWPRLAALLVICLLAGVVWLPRQHAALLLAGLAWLAGFAAFSMLLDIETIGWLEYFALVGVALIIGAGVEGALTRLRGGRAPFESRWRSTAATAASVGLLAALAVFSGASLGTSALFHDYYQWRVAGTTTQRYLSALTTCVENSPAVSRVVLVGLPASLDDGRAETSMLGVTLLQDWTVQSALNLELPNRPMTVRVESRATLRGPAETLKFACSPRQDVVEFSTTY